MVRLRVGLLTIDKYPLSIVVDFAAQIEENRGKSRSQRPPNPAILESLVTKAKTSQTSVERRAEELDTIASVLPLERRDELAELLTDQDVETLRHLVNQGMGDNTLRALTSDLTYLEAWGLATTGKSLPWPAPEALLLKFVAHHLWDPEKRATDPNHGMPAEVDNNLRQQGFLKAVGPHAPDTVRRRLASWSSLTKWRGLSGAFSSPSLKSAIRLAVRAVPRTRRRKSAKAVTGDVLAKLLASCSGDSLRDVRDRAILMVAFASGGRRRSEVAGLRLEQLTVEVPIEVADGPPLPSLAIHLGRTKTTTGEEDDVVYLTGRPVEALNTWLAAAKIDKGSVFRGIGRWGTVSKRPLDPQSVNAIVKQRAEMAGLDPAEFSAHGLRSGYLTEAANRGIPLPEAMEQSKHRSVQQASSYYNNATRRSGRATRLLT
ncbi:related integrase [Agrobacterium tumefaciens str. B6]|uniref:Related integrase n=1 Tax=Agrobacterium tumefaciens str. B6 TaxID=1183423 RepID=A0A822VCI4_AGRTU|nr:site-specific integrase [Agrobacterium tumefaciens]CVI25119.1 related integrase [Agrobacterium tumefaciens str. B6]